MGLEECIRFRLESIEEEVFDKAGRDDLERGNERNLVAAIVCRDCCWNGFRDFTVAPITGCIGYSSLDETTSEVVVVSKALGYP